MTAIVLQHVDKIARNLTPFLISILLVLFSMLPIYIPYYGPVAANMGVMAVFYWVVYRPDLLPPSGAFLIGLWQDIMVGTPLGLNAFILLVVELLLALQRRFFQGKSFLVVWWAFGMIAFFAGLLGWVLMMALHRVWLGPSPAVFQFFITVALYPFVTWILARTQHAILR